MDAGPRMRIFGAKQRDQFAMVNSQIYTRIVGDLRQALSPMRLEQLLFLRSNRDLWNVHIVNELVKSKLG
jgi:hypothetical protein